MSQVVDAELLDRCASDPGGPAALHLAQELIPAEGRGAPFFPPTFAMDERYNIDTLADGTSVALVDSVGSQANRLEPMFLRGDLRALVPQVEIRYGELPHERVSLLEAGHRLGDAVVRSTELRGEARDAFLALQHGDAEPIARLAPTSIVFGAWDSRGTGVKVPRIVQSVVRAWGVSRLSRSAQYVPALDYARLGVFDDADKLKKEDQKALSERGFLHVPSTHDHGGIVALGPIRRDVTLNLVALRRLGGPRGEDLRRYVLGLALVAATEPCDPFLRQGCILVPDGDAPARWTVVGCDGARTEITMTRQAVVGFAREAAQVFGVAEDRTVRFDARLARQDMTQAKGKKA